MPLPKEDQIEPVTQKPLLQKIDRWIADMERENFKLAKGDQLLIEKVLLAHEKKVELL